MWFDLALYFCLPPASNTMTLQQKIDCAVAHISAGTHYIGTKNQISGVAVECKATADAKAAQ
jgi:hypothetical protein